MEKQEEIIAYRVGDHFLCPNHYQMSAKILKVHDIELPAQPVKEGEIKSFVCTQCEDTAEDTADERIPALPLPQKQIIEPTRKTLRKKESIDLLTLQDIVEDCGTKVSFLADFFVQKGPGCEPDITASGASGLAMILDEIKDDLNFVVKTISERAQKGLIIEKTEQH